MNRAARITRLERMQGETPRPWLSLGRTDRDVADAIAFEGCPLYREPGEAWDTFTTRAQRWAHDKPPFIAYVIYRETAQ